MVKKLIVSAFSIITGFITIAQENLLSKPMIDSSVFDKWSNSYSGIGISNDGAYALYAIGEPLFLSDRLIVQSTDGKWGKQFDNVNYASASIMQNNKIICFQRHDSIFIARLGENGIEYCADIKNNYTHVPLKDDDDFLLYSLKGDSGKLTIKKISSGELRKFDKVERYWYEKNSGIFILLVKSNNNDTKYYLKLADFSKKESIEIWRGDYVENLVFSMSGSGAAFLTRNNNVKTIWYSDFGKHTMLKLVDDQSSDIEPNLKINDINSLLVESDRVLFTLSTKVASKAPSGVGVDVYNYKDAKLQSEQLYLLRNSYPRTYQASVNIADKKILQIEKENEFISLTELSHNWALLWTNKGGLDFESYWNPQSTITCSFVSLKDGNRKIISENETANFRTWIAPGERYVVYYDPGQLNYFSIDISKGIRKNITSSIHTQWTSDPKEQISYKYSPFGIGGFTEDGRYALIYDLYDIYKIDLSGESAPIKLTKGYGRQHGIVFRIELGSANGHRFSGSCILATNKKIILKAVNERNGDHGFYSIDLIKQSSKLDSLTMQPVELQIVGSARDGGGYIVKLWDAGSYPNLFFSKDLRRFTSKTDLHPERNYNWLTSELVSWKLHDGKLCRGILYKPENFDPHKKYPMLVHYYENMSQNLHSFIKPENSGGYINIPFYVSNGYLVFTPDIHYTVGMPGKSAYSSVVSGVKYLLRRGYIDSGKIGLQGISFGGFETNYIIAHTNMFAAAIALSSMTNFISAYGSIIGDGTSRQRQYEFYRDRMGGTPWKIPEKYIDNSPVLRADKIKTPLLLMANIEDDDVPYQQGIELYTALRRLNKKAWMLQYDGEGHGLRGKDPTKDLTIRMFQFFNYYLKDAPPPKWMTEGVPAAKKGMFTGLELDYSGKKP